jgi:hypothetical protein
MRSVASADRIPAPKNGHLAPNLTYNSLKGIAAQAKNPVLKNQIGNNLPVPTATAQLISEISYGV